MAVSGAAQVVHLPSNLAALQQLGQGSGALLGALLRQQNQKLGQGAQFTAPTGAQTELNAQEAQLFGNLARQGELPPGASVRPAGVPFLRNILPPGAIGPGPEQLRDLQFQTAKAGLGKTQAETAALSPEAIAAAQAREVEEARLKKRAQLEEERANPSAQEKINQAIVNEFFQIPGTGQTILPAGEVGTAVGEDLLKRLQERGFKGTLNLGPLSITESAASEKQRMESKELAGSMENIFQMFNAARAEASEVPGFGEEGLKGRVAGIGAQVKGLMGELPDLQSFSDEVAAFATKTAKAAGEVRPTDADIRRFSKAMLNVGRNDRENANKMASVLRQMRARDASVDWARPLIDEFEASTGVTVNFEFDPVEDSPVIQDKPAKGGLLQPEPGASDNDPLGLR